MSAFSSADILSHQITAIAGRLDFIYTDNFTVSGSGLAVRGTRSKRRSKDFATPRVSRSS